ncbi:MAG: di-heme oxidoredictase family protein [Polyangiaceae bacterium]
MTSTRRRAALCAAIFVAGCGGDPGKGETSDPDEPFSGGRVTVFDTSRMAFAQAAPGLASDLEDEFFVGNAIFNRGWVAAPASVEQFDGLGPIYNATSCSACHFKDGRGRPPVTPDESFLDLLIRVSIPGAGAHGEPLADPTYGGQIHGSSIFGVTAEARESLTYEEIAGSFADGESYSLRAPTYAVAGAFGPLASGAMLSPRVAPAVFGLGLLEAIPEATLVALADPNDRDGDGISGRLNHVWDIRQETVRIGRFGWKASQPSIEQQSAGAFVGDMGLTSTLFPRDECTAAEPDCMGAPSGGSPELSESLLASVVTYSHLLAAPARRHWNDVTVRQGKELFARAACTGCHLSEIRTGADLDFSVLSHQTIRPYTDLLLHDMGAGLADGRPDFEATGSEWRTPPLWGIGLVPTVNRHSFFLHDGRARSLAEAILWHGGEAQESRARFVKMTKAERDALVSFLESL